MQKKALLMLVTTALGLSSGLGSLSAQADSTGTSVGEVTIDNSNIRPLRLDSVPQLTFERVHRDAVMDASTESLDAMTAESVNGHPDGHLVVSDERSSGEQAQDPWSVNARLVAVQNETTAHELVGTTMSLTLSDQAPVVISQRASRVVTAPQNGLMGGRYTNDVTDAQLMIPAQSHADVGHYRVLVEWQLVNSAGNEVDDEVD